MNRGEVILSVVKSVKNPRSAVCKTAIMTSGDLFTAFGDQMIEFLDPLVTEISRPCNLSTFLSFADLNSVLDRQLAF